MYGQRRKGYTESVENQLLKEYNDRILYIEQFDQGTFRDVVQKISEYRENMRHFSLVVGGVAAASLASLGLPIQKVNLLIIVGSCYLIVMAFLCFVHLFIDNRTEMNGLLEFRKSLKPLGDVLTAFEALTLEKIDRKEYDRIEAEYQKHKNDVLSGTTRDITKSFISNNNEVWLMMAVALGLGVVLAGFLLPLFTGN